MFIEHYDSIYWPGMDITRDEIDEILGIVRKESNNLSMHMPESNGNAVLSMPEWPIDAKKQKMLRAYVHSHEKNPKYFNFDGIPVILVNRHLTMLK